jgi:hypothetical protein
MSFPVIALDSEIQGWKGHYAAWVCSKDGPKSNASVLCLTLSSDVAGVVLQLELAGLADSAAAVQGKVLEMTALSHLFSTRVLQQAQQIEQLYNQAVEATMYIKKGNTELRKTVDRNSDGRIFIILFFVIMILAVLFLDWYSP